MDIGQRQNSKLRSQKLGVFEKISVFERLRHKCAINFRRFRLPKSNLTVATPESTERDEPASAGNACQALTVND
jgi:hypothetical protein